MVVKKDRFRKFRKEHHKLMEKCQLSPYALSRLTEFDSTLLKRVVTGERNPSRNTVHKIAIELRGYTSIISDSDVDRLIKASGIPHPGICDGRL